MAKFIDPVCYRIYFGGISENDQDQFIKDVFITLINSFKKQLVSYLSIGLPKTYRDSVRTIRDGRPGNLTHFIGSFSTINTTEQKLDALLRLLEKDPDYFGFIMHGCLKNDQIPYFDKSTRFGRDYVKWFGNHTYIISDGSYLENRKILGALLNCPSDDLNDVVIPSSMTLHGNELFCMELYRIPIAATNERPYPYQVIMQSPDLQDDGYFYQLSITIPRFIIGKDTDTIPMQNKWRDMLLRLGEHFPVSIGTLQMDCSLFLNGFSCYDDKTRSEMEKRFFAEYIPGYSWGTLISSSQAQMVDQCKQDEMNGVFYDIQKLKNGNRYYQLTDDMRIVPLQKAIELRNFFRPFLPPVNIPFRLGRSPISLRMGFTESEFQFARSKEYDDEIFHIVTIP